MEVLDAVSARKLGLNLQNYSTHISKGKVFGRVRGVGVGDLGQVMLFFDDSSTGKSYAVILLQDYYDYVVFQSFQKFMSTLNINDLCQLEIENTSEGIVGAKLVDVVEKAKPLDGE